MTSSPPSSSIAIPPPSERTALAFESTRTSTPNPRRPSATCSLANGSFLGEEARAALDQGHLRAEGRERLRHLDADRAAPQHEQALGNRLRAGRARGSSSSRPSRGRRSAGSAAVEPVAIATALRATSTSSPTRTRRSPSSSASTAIELDALLLEPGQLAGVVPVLRDLVAAREGRLGVEVARHRLRGAIHPPHLGERLAGPEQRLRGHAGVVRALPADELVLDDRGLEPAVGRPAGAHLAGRAGADHDEVEFPLAHRWREPTPTTDCAPGRSRRRRSSSATASPM